MCTIYISQLSTERGIDNCYKASYRQSLLNIRHVTHTPNKYVCVWNVWLLEYCKLSLSIPLYKQVNKTGLGESRDT